MPSDTLARLLMEPPTDEHTKSEWWRNIRRNDPRFGQVDAELNDSMPGYVFNGVLGTEQPYAIEDSRSRVIHPDSGPWKNVPRQMSEDGKDQKRNALAAYPKARQEGEGWGAFLTRSAPEALSTVLLGLSAIRPAEVPVAAAIKFGDQIRTGPNHGSIIGFMDANLPPATADGFVTNFGRFVSRDEAAGLMGVRGVREKYSGLRRFHSTQLPKKYD